MSEPAPKPFLQLVVCAAGIAAGVSKLITAAQERNWEVGVTATPVALGGFFDDGAVEAQSGRPVRSAWRTPADPRPFPSPDAVVVAPATFNTINKWAAGIADTLALGTLCEAYGLGVPIAVLPCVGDALAAHPAYRASLLRLRAMGVRIGEPYDGEPDAPGRPAGLRVGTCPGPAGAALSRASGPDDGRLLSTGAVLNRNGGCSTTPRGLPETDTPHAHARCCLLLPAEDVHPVTETREALGPGRRVKPLCLTTYAAKG